LAGVMLARPNRDMAFHFSKLLILSAPSFFEELWGSLKFEVARFCFFRRRNLFSYRHTLFLSEGEKIKGMALGYSFEEKRRERLLTGLSIISYLLFYGERKRVPFLLRVFPLGEIKQGEFYLSNLALYPEYQAQGLGKKLLGEVEKKAKKAGADYLVLDVDEENGIAISFYKRLGYLLETELPPVELGGVSFRFLRMKKCLK